MKSAAFVVVLLFAVLPALSQFQERNVAITPVNAAMIISSSYQASVMVDFSERRDWIELGLIAGLSNWNYSGVGGESGFFVRYRLNLVRDKNLIFKGNSYVAPYFHYVSNKKIEEPQTGCCNYSRSAVGIAFATSFDITESFFLDVFLGLDSGKRKRDDPNSLYGNFNQVRGIIGIQPGFRL